MKVAIVTGSNGLIGSEAVNFFSSHFDKIIGIDNNMRSYFFGEDATTHWQRSLLEKQISNYLHEVIDIRDYSALQNVFKLYSTGIKLILHTAAQPSHDWAAKEPLTDFSINATGTSNLLELCRVHCQEAVFILTSTNKVYGDRPNSLPLIEKDTRFEIAEDHPYSIGIDESMSIDQSKHSLFGASKVAADILAQEYGRYFNMSVGVFRGGCLTGPNHSGSQLHGFLSFLTKCAITKAPYTIFGYKGKQVRDNIHSYDLIKMFWHFYNSPKKGEVYNVGGGRFANCSMIEAIKLCEDLTGSDMKYSLIEETRIGDHQWWISDVSKFRRHYPEWNYTYNIQDIVTEIYQGLLKRES